MFEPDLRRVGQGSPSRGSRDLRDERRSQTFPSQRGTWTPISESQCGRLCGYHLDADLAPLVRIFVSLRKSLNLSEAHFPYL